LTLAIIASPGCPADLLGAAVISGPTTTAKEPFA
jgi:hypothetical protein